MSAIFSASGVDYYQSVHRREAVNMAKYTSVGEGLDAARIAGAGEASLPLPRPRLRAHGRGPGDLGLSLGRCCAELNLPVMRTKASCFRICVGGPWLLIYPEGVWYGSVTPERCERILQEHVDPGQTGQ